MMIVLEGVDGAGKTTLAEALAKQYNAGIIHATRETPNDWAWFNELLDLAKDHNLIMDRAFWGQFVYQESQDRKLSFKQVHDLEARVKREGGKIIYVEAAKEDILDRLSKRAEELSLPLDTLLFRYEARILESYCPVVRFNTSTGEVH